MSSRIRRSDVKEALQRYQYRGMPRGDEEVASLMSTAPVQTVVSIATDAMQTRQLRVSDTVDELLASQAQLDFLEGEIRQYEVLTVREWYLVIKNAQSTSGDIRVYETAGGGIPLSETVVTVPSSGQIGVVGGGIVTRYQSGSDDGKGYPGLTVEAVPYVPDGSPTLQLEATVERTVAGQSVPVQHRTPTVVDRIPSSLQP